MLLVLVVNTTNNLELINLFFKVKSLLLQVYVHFAVTVLILDGILLHYTHTHTSEMFHDPKDW